VHILDVFDLIFMIVVRGLAIAVAGY